MTPLVLIALIAGVPVLVALILRVHALYVFVSIAVGALVVNAIGETSALTAQSFVKADQTELITKLILFVLPLVLTLFLLRKTLPTAQFLFHIGPLVANGFLLLVLLLPLLTPGVQGTIQASQLGNVVYRSSEIIVAGVAIAHLLLMWATSRPNHGKHGKHGKHH